MDLKVIDHSRTRLLAFGAIVVVVAVALGAYAVGAGRSAKNVTLCAAKSGAVSLASGDKCAKGEKKVTIAKQGPMGPAGETGPQGPQGTAGTTASIQPESPTAVSDARPTSQGVCGPSSPGIFCGAPGFEGVWLNIPGALGGDGPPVSYQKDAAGFVHLAGMAWAASAGSGGGPDTSRIFYLPPGYRPTNGSIDFIANGLCGGAIAPAVKIHPDGGVVPGAGCVSLNGISFYP